MTTDYPTQSDSSIRIGGNVVGGVIVLGNNNVLNVQHPLSSSKSQRKKRKLLILAVNPKRSERLRLDEEVRDIKEGLRRAHHGNDFEIVDRGAVRFRDLSRALMEEKPQIVHFSGHGEGEAGLYFEDSEGNPELVTGEVLSSLLEACNRTSPIECIVLNGCYSRIQAETIIDHVPYAVGMNQSVVDRAAIEFSVGFYDALWNGEDIEVAFAVGKAGMQQYSRDKEDTPVLLRQDSQNSLKRTQDSHPKTEGLTANAAIAERHFTKQIKPSDIVDTVSILPETVGCIQARANQPVILISEESGDFWVVSDEQTGKLLHLLPQNKTKFRQSSLGELSRLYNVVHSQSDLEIPISITEAAAVRAAGKGKWKLQKQGKLVFSDMSRLARLYNTGQVVHMDDVRGPWQVKPSTAVSCTTESVKSYHTGEEAPALLLSDKNGSYWLLSDENQHYLVPDPTAKFQTCDAESLPLLYDYSQISGSMDSFIVLQPAVLNAVSRNTWQVLKKGKLRFR